LRLIFVIASSRLADHDLTFAAEALGLITTVNVSLVVTVLQWLAGHKSPIVREGVVYGLARHTAASANARAVLARLARHDESSEVRTAAAEALED